LIRAPEATRPWQHVLDPLAGYLLYLEALAAGQDVPRSLNFGPVPGDSVTVAELATTMSEAMGVAGGWERDPVEHPHEAAALSLDSSLARQSLGWAPRLALREAASWTALWYADFAKGADARALCDRQIADYEALR
jgi:CDP-glucose 4,6-dehydratase